MAFALFMTAIAIITFLVGLIAIVAHTSTPEYAAYRKSYNHGCNGFSKSVSHDTATIRQNDIVVGSHGALYRVVRVDADGRSKVRNLNSTNRSGYGYVKTASLTPTGEVWSN